MSKQRTILQQLSDCLWALVALVHPKRHSCTIHVESGTRSLRPELMFGMLHCSVCFLESNTQIFKALCNQWPKPRAPLQSLVAHARARIFFRSPTEQVSGFDKSERHADTVQ